MFFVLKFSVVFLFLIMLHAKSLQLCPTFCDSTDHKNNFKADLSQQNPKDDNLYHPKGETVLNHPKTALNQKVEVKLSGNKDEFNKILKDYEFRLQEIIENINSTYEFKRRIGYKDLEEFINQTLRGKYESELKEYINTYIKK